MNKYLKGLLLVLIIVITGCSSQINNRDIVLSDDSKLKIAVSNDMHLLSDKLHDDGQLFNEVIENGDGKVLDYSFDIFNAFLKQCEDERVDIVVLNGDLTLNGEKQTHLDIAEILNDFESRTGISVIVLPGNHDINNVWARSYNKDSFKNVESVTLSEFKEIYKDFGYSEARSSTDNDSYLIRATDDIWFMMIDSTMHNSAIKHPITNGKVDDVTLDFIDESLADAKDSGAQVISFMHHNIIDHNDFNTDGFTIDNASEVINVFEKYDMNILFSGHTHAQDIKEYNDEDYKLTDVVTSSLVITPNQFGIITQLNDNKFSYETKTLDMNSYVKNNNIKDDNLENFETYSKDTFLKVSDNKFSDNVNDSEILDYINDVNYCYFSGTMNENYTSLVSNDMYSYIVNNDLDFMSTYVRDLVITDDISDNYYEFSI